MVTDGRTLGNGTKLNQGRFELDIRKKIFTVRVVKHCKRIPKRRLILPCLSVLSNMLLVNSEVVRELDLMITIVMITV